MYRFEKAVDILGLHNCKFVSYINHIGVVGYLASFITVPCMASITPLPKVFIWVFI